ncbi:MAG: 4Fe-4S binding protein, partial [Clostridia bacterium]|nr:4Fe-4S binding protein [Clostridia bacterium]
MKRQNIRKLSLVISLLLFPITLYYFSPALIMNGALNGIINGSFIVFALMLILSIPFGRIFCSWLCPAGGLQECAFMINDKRPKQGWKNSIKYVIWGIWIVAVILCYIYSGEIISVDFFYETESGISVSDVQSYIIYYGIVCLIFIPSVLFGKRVFCHYVCWMAPFMVLGRKLGTLFHLPGLPIRVKN